MANNLSRVQNKVAKEIFFQFSQTGQISKNIEFRNELISAQDNTGATVVLRRPTMVDVNQQAFTPGLYDAANQIVAPIPSAPTYTTINDAGVPLTVSQKFIVNLNRSLDECTVNMSSEQATERVIRPAVLRLRRLVDQYVGKLALLQAGQIIGTPSSYSATPLTQYANAAALLNNRGLDPAYDRAAITPESVGVTLQTSQQTLFNPQRNVEKLYREGTMGQYSGLDFYRSPLLPTDPSLVAQSGVTTTAAQTGSTLWTPTFTVAITGLTAGLNGSSTALVGSIVSFANTGVAIRWVNPDLKTDTGTTATFVVVAHTTITSTACTLTLSEPLISTGAYQNVTTGITSGATVTFLNATTTTTPGLVFAKNAIVGVSPKFNLPSGLDYSAQEEVDGINVAIIESHDPYTFTKIHAIQCMIGAAAVIPEGLVRVY